MTPFKIKIKEVMQHHFYHILLERASHWPVLIQKGKLISLSMGRMTMYLQPSSIHNVWAQKKYVSAVRKTTEQIK